MYILNYGQRRTFAAVAVGGTTCLVAEHPNWLSLDELRNMRTRKRMANSRNTPEVHTSLTVIVYVGKLSVTSSPTGKL